VELDYLHLEGSHLHHFAYEMSTHKFWNEFVNPNYFVKEFTFIPAASPDRSEASHGASSGAF
jgi:hypothetical protein